jgi:hypothetical protein
MVPDSRNDQICAVGGDHAGLDESRPRIAFLDDRVNADERNDDTQDQVEGDKELVQAAP